jgi:hypothetical protein
VAPTPSNKSSALQRQLAGETAASLGRLGREVEFALAQLTAQKAAPTAAYTAMVNTCAQLVWEYFVQREACGLPDQSRVIELLGIPEDVLRQVGATSHARSAE